MINDNTLFYVLGALILLWRAIDLLIPSLHPWLEAKLQERLEQIKRNTPEGRRELIEWAAQTSYEGVEQLRKTKAFEQAFNAADGIDIQAYLKEEAKRRALALLRTSGQRISDEGLVAMVLDTVLEQIIYREHHGRSAAEAEGEVVGTFKAQPAVLAENAASS